MPSLSDESGEESERRTGIGRIGVPRLAKDESCAVEPLAPRLLVCQKIGGRS